MEDQDLSQSVVGASSVQESAADLFHTAALLLGEEQEAVSVVEQVVAEADTDPCCHPANAHREARERVIAESLKRMGKHSAGGLDAQVAAGGLSPNICIEGDDLSAAGLTTEELNALLDGPGRARLRQWLDRLSPALRAVFVLRALFGWSNDVAAENLRGTGAKGTEGWTSAGVSQVFRQALCSLATSLLHSTGEHISSHAAAKS